MTYSKLNNGVRRVTDAVNENWLENQSSDTEAHENTGRYNLMYLKARKLYGKRFRVHKNTEISNKQEHSYQIR